MTGIDPVELTAELVRRPSLTPDEAGCFDLIEAALRPLGFEVTRLSFASGGARPVPNLFATVGGEGPHFAFNGHVDVVPPGDLSRWSVDPFAGVIQEGRLFGRGSADMKSGVAAFTAARTLRLVPLVDIAINTSPALPKARTGRAKYSSSP